MFRRNPRKIASFNSSYEAIEKNFGFWGLTPKPGALATDSTAGSLAPAETYRTV